MEFVKAASRFRMGSTRSIRNNDFFSDRLSHRHTIKILVVFIVLVSFKKFFSSPVNCWVPAELKRYEKYINRYCWLKGTYYVEQSYDVHALDMRAREENLLHYYQWIYCFLMFQAFLFYLPRLFWSCVSSKLLGYDLLDLVDAAIKYDEYNFNMPRVQQFLISSIINQTSVSRDKKMSNLLTKLVAEQDKTRKYQYTWFPVRHLSMTWLTLTYVFTKCLYLLVACVQIYLMNLVLSTRAHSFYGLEVLQRIYMGQADLGYEPDSTVFPRITVCDVKTIELGRDHTYTFQCLLAFNLFNERIYAFLWFWIFCVLIPFTALDLAQWVKRLLLGSFHRYQFVKSHVKIYNKVNTKREKYLLKLFTELILGQDAIFVLRMLEHNSNAIVVSDAFNEMWNNFRKDFD